VIPGLEMLACQDLAVPAEVMEHVVRVESSFNPYAIGVVGARLARQPRSLDEAVATASRLERDGYNFSLGLAQVNRHNLAAQGLSTYELAFDACPNLAAGARILHDCHVRADGDWGKAFSCYYSGNFSRGFRDGYVEKIRRSMAAADAGAAGVRMAAIPVVPDASRPSPAGTGTGTGLLARRAAAAAPVDPPVAALPDPAAGDSGMAVPVDAKHAGHRRVVGFEAVVDDGPFVPQVTPPGAGRRPPSPMPSRPARGRDGDSAFVF